MKHVAALLLLLAAGVPASAQDDDGLRRRLERKEADLERLDEEIRRALDEKKTAKAERLNREYRELKREVEELRGRIGKEPPGHGFEPRRPPKREPDDLHSYVSAELLFTNWGSGAHVSDGTGLGLELALPDWLFFQYRTWRLEDDATGVDVRAQAYLFGFTETIELEGSRHYFDMAAAFGILNLAADEGGPDTDSGPMLSLQPVYRMLLRENLILHVGASFDLYWTDFNHHHTHDHWNSSLVAGLTLKF